MALNIIRQLLRRVGLETAITLLLLLVALGSVILPLSNLVRSLSLGLLIPIMLAGLLFSWRLAAIRQLPGGLAWLIMLALGAEIMVLHVANQESTLLQLAQNSVHGAGLLAARGITIDLATLPPLAAPLVELGRGLNILLARLVNWTAVQIAGKPAFDPVVSVLVWGLAVWLMSIWAGWFVRRRANVLAALLPAGALLATVLAYHPRQASSLLPLTGAALLLLGLVRAGALERYWDNTGIDFSPVIKTEIAFVVIPVSVVLLLLAGFAPSVSVWSLARRAQHMLSGPVEKAEPAVGALGLAAEPVNPEDPNLRRLKTPGLPQRHLLGSGPELQETVELVITQDLAVPPGQLYWRGLTYDNYTGRGWATGKTNPLSYQAGEVSTAATDADQLLVRFNVQLMTNNPPYLLYSPGPVVTANHPYRVNWRGPEDAFAGTIDTQNYQIESLILKATYPAALNSGGEYPDHIFNRYLRLPADTPDRVLALARDLTATAPTPFDRAKAIEDYLRRFPYSLDLPEPPRNRDMVDYFLFDLQQGYCDYYASAMVVLARAAGLPARLVVGYASGTFDADQNRTVVTAADAHSWPEIYFPGHGWVRFEPTAAQPQIDRGTALDIPPLPAATPSTPVTFQPPNLGVVGWLVAGAALLTLLAALSVATVWQVDLWWLRAMPPNTAIAAVYVRLQSHANRLAIPVQPGDTPYEFATRFADDLHQITGRSRLQKLLESAGTELHRLTQLYVQTSYSNHPGRPSDRQETVTAWRQLRRRLWLAWLTQTIFAATAATLHRFRRKESQ